MAKYDWKQLEKEYILSDYKSVSAFLKDKGIKRNGSVQQAVKGWNEKKVQKEFEKSSKVIEKTIEKESEKEAQQIADIKSIANELALNVLKANTELNKHIAKSKTKTKTVIYDSKALKPSKEVTKEQEEANEYIGIIDRQGLKMLSSALKDLNEILVDKKGNDTNNINQNIQNIAYLINNPKKVRIEDDLNE
jgi:hypothetical protein|nr:MAG TPA: hypothetical protein [Bacteriophage sp.]